MDAFFANEKTFKIYEIYNKQEDSMLAVSRSEATYTDSMRAKRKFTIEVMFD